MLRTSLRSARLLGSQPITAAAGRQWAVSASRRTAALQTRYYADEKKPDADKSKAPILPTSETNSSDRTPGVVTDAVVDKIKNSEIPLTPPPPAEESTVKSAAKSAAAAAAGSVAGSAAPKPKKKGFFRRLRNFVTTLMILGVIGFSGGVWYSRINDNFHDFFTEFVPFGEQAVLYLEELEFKKRFPHASSGGGRGQGSEQIRIPAQSGASWRVADSGEPVSRTSSSTSASKKTKTSKEQPPAHENAVKPETTAVTDATSSSKSSDKVAAASAASTSKGGKAKKDSKGPEVDEPSRFPPLEPIDLMSLPDANEPVVQDLVRMLNDLILVINSDGAHGRYSTSIAKAKADVTSVGQKLKQLKDVVEKKAAGEVRSTITEFDKGASDLIQRVENTMVQQELQWRQEFEQEMQNVRKSYDERVKLLMEREQKLHEEQLANKLLEQAIALKKEFVSEVKGRVEKEREGRLSQLEKLSSAVSELEKLSVGWNSVVDSNLKTQQLHVAVEAVRANIEGAQHPRPFIKELVALKEIASDDSVVDAAIASVNPSAYQKGIASTSNLVDRFRRVASEVRKASLLPDDAGVASHASSWVLSHVMFKKQGLADGDDVESILTRTQTYLEEGDLDNAAREMNGLQGWAKTLSKDWIGEVRKVLEVQQALDVISTEARLQSLRVD